MTFSAPLRSADRVSIDQFSSAFDKFSTEVKRRVFKLERLQNYMEPDNESWRELQAGNIERSLELIPTIRAREAKYDVEFFRRGLQFLRVRAVELPLSPYVDWEFQSYVISAQYGETILIGDMTDIDRSGVLWNAHDFLLFDSFAALIHDYNSDGLLRGGWICEDEETINYYVDLASQFTSISVPLAVFMASHPSRYVHSKTSSLGS